MPNVLIVHEVADYAVWKRIFDDASAIRRNAGEIRYQLYRRDHDANSIVHFSEWSSLAAARAFFASDELAQIRRRAGVKEPDFIYLEAIEAGDLQPDISSREQ